MKKVSLLNVEIKIRNKRENHLVACTRRMCEDTLEWLDEQFADGVVETVSMEDRRDVARRNVEEINGLFRAMYFMDMIKEPHYFHLRDLEAWNGAN